MTGQQANHGAQGAFDERFGFDVDKEGLDPASVDVASSDLGNLSRARLGADDSCRSSFRGPFFAWLRACPVPRGDLASIPSLLIGPCPSPDDGGSAALPPVHGKWVVSQDVAAWRLKRDRKRLWEMFFVTCLQRIGYVVFHDPISGKVVELKRPFWLKDEDKA